MQINSQNFNSKFQPNNTPAYKGYFAARKEIQADKFEKSHNKKNITFTGLINSTEISKICKEIKTAVAETISAASAQETANKMPEIISDIPNTFLNEITSIEEIQRIRQGELGRIRGAEELSPNDVLKVMKNQLKPYSVQEVESIINTFKPEDKELALKTLQKMSQYGNMQSLKHLTESLFDLVDETNSEIFVTGPTNISASLEYLRKKGSFSTSGLLHRVFTGDFKDNRILILDEFLLKELEADNSLLELIKSKENITIAYPEGWINGNNPFNHSTTQEIQQRAAIIVENVKRIKNDTGLSDSRAVEEALNSPVLERINKLGLTDNLKILKNNTKVANPNAEHIAELLAPMHISEKEILEQIEQIPPKYRQAALEIVSREARVFSARTLNEIAKRQQQKILKIAEKKGIPEENIYYHVPDCYKSYGIVALQHQIANNISGEKFLSDLSEISKSENSMIVVLDDVAGSGMSLKGNYKSIKRDFVYNGEVVIAPIISTIRAESVFKPMTKLDRNLTYLPGEIITSFRDNTYFFSLPDKQKILIEKVIMDKGFDFNALNIAFPYMSPDNNNSMFATLFAPKLLLGGKDAAKNSSWLPQFLFEEVNPQKSAWLSPQEAYGSKYKANIPDKLENIKNNVEKSTMMKLDISGKNVDDTSFMSMKKFKNDLINKGIQFDGDYYVGNHDI